MVSGTNGFNYDKVFSYLNSNTQTVRSVTGQTSNGNVSAFVKKMTKEFGAGHPAKPMPVFERYSNEMKEREPDLDTKTISASYKKLKKSQLLELKTKYQFDLEEYKNEVRSWAGTLSDEVRIAYCAKHAKNEDPNEYKMQENIYILEPKTPAAYQPLEIEEVGTGQSEDSDK
jgi:hypothetical protein